jgi:NAD(P)-dependent dehydrogenase (short-subunit alcohol dehydrogenase family)
VTLTGLVDAALEVPVAPSFTRVGYELRSRLGHWAPAEGGDLTGRVVLVTGSTSGLGLAAAERLAARGAEVVVSGRDPARTRRIRDDLCRRTGNDSLGALPLNLADAGSVRAGAEEMASRHPRLDVLVHNAGALNAERRVAPDGTEETVAAQVFGPFLLTALLLAQLRRAAPGRVLTMSSGGMYAAPLAVTDLEMTDDGYSGTEQYARAKRAQVTLNEMWAERVDPNDVVFQALHPGWADTPGVAESLPTFRRVLGPLLRTPEQGADTLVWLATAEEPLRSSGGFWHDRRPRAIHRLPWTRRSDTADSRRALWELCVHRTGIEPADARGGPER